MNVSDAELDDLRDRLRRTRWATSWPVGPWEAGTDGDELRRLVGYWASDYDWRKHEAEINALPSHVADIDGTPVHYLRYDGGGFPLVLTNGWPSSFLELTGLASRLAADGFTVVVPSLPGFGLSPQRPNFPEPTHEIWHRLMHDELGFHRYGAHGSDLGAGVTVRLGQTHPEAVAGIHVQTIGDPPTPPADLTDEERAYLKAKADWHVVEGGYSHEQRTRPLTLAQGLSDSPSGLLAWILEKYRAWSDSGGDVSRRFSDDFLLTQASFYWFTNAISTSFRPYYDGDRGLLADRGRVEVPTALALFPAEIGAPPPRSWVERYYNLTRYTRMPRGGHFAAHEEPELLADDLKAFFGPLAQRAGKP